VRVASRSGSPAFDWQQPETWAAQLAGVKAVYLAYYPDLVVPDAEPNIRNFAQLAARSGVEQLVLLSGRGEPEVLVSEQAVHESGVPWTTLRAAWFCQNFSEGAFRDQVLGGELPFPGGDTAEPFLDIDDLAEVAERVLTEPGHLGQTYELTGPEPITFAQAMDILSNILGTSVRYIPVSTDEYTAILGNFYPPELARLLADLFGRLLDGHNAHCTHTVEQLLGRKPRDFESFARKAAAAGAWAR
jgi:uncharacterized protein YbjT (DUF2867 family)